jgi:cell division protein FtsQ
VIAVLLAWGGWTVWKPTTFPVRSVRIDTPLVHVTQEEIRKAVIPFATKGFLRIDMDGLRSKLQEIPWVYRATLRRAWPDVIEVSLEEQVPVARWQAGGLVNEHGELFKPEQTSEQEALPEFSGPDVIAATIVKNYLELSQILKPLQLKVARLAVSERRAWNVQLDNGLNLNMGRADTSLRLQRLVKVYAQTIAPRLDEIESVDLRYTNGFAIHWRTGQVPTA